MKMPISMFVAELKAAEKRKDGYIMGACGEDPKKWSLTSWWYTQYENRKKYTEEQEEKAKYWREHAQRVWDCNGLPEGIFHFYSGENINTKARYNYAEWCSEKGAGMIPKDKRVPGMAVFWSPAKKENGKTVYKAGDISHVAFLVEPVDPAKPDGDWVLCEAKGVLYGVCFTRLKSRNPKFWGKMTKYFDYDEQPEELPEHVHTTVKRGDEGAEVLELQQALLKIGFTLPKYGADGEFGAETETAVKKLQKDKGFKQDGICGAELWGIIDESLNSDIIHGCVIITGGSVNVRAGAGTEFAVRKTVHKGDIYSYSAISEGGWYRIADGWVSGKYAHKVEVSV